MTPVSPTAGASTPAPAAQAGSPLLRIEDLAVSFVGGGERPRAVDGVRLTIHPGRTLAVVGESGCGKSVTAMSVLRLLPAGAARIEHGRVWLRGRGGEPSTDLCTLSERRMRRIRGGQIAMIFQEPMTSLNPVYSIGEQVIEAIRLHQQATAAEAVDIACGAMHRVGIRDARTRLGDFPHQFSGGMRQRVMIAMALACRPRLLLADEPTTALDVTVQAQILDLLHELRAERGLAIMLISHALGVVAENADAVCVMYAGRIVEYAPVLELFERPLHPYTRGLLRCAPRLGERRARLTTVMEVVSAPAEFERLEGAARGLRPWWPAHTPPPGVVAKSSGPATDYELLEIEPRHWVGVWRTPPAAEWIPSFPDIHAGAPSAPRAN